MERWVAAFKSRVRICIFTTPDIGVDPITVQFTVGETWSQYFEDVSGDERLLKISWIRDEESGMVVTAKSSLGLLHDGGVK